MFPRRGLTVRTLTALAVCGALTGAGSLGLADSAQAAPAAHSSMRLLAVDNMRRHVSVGLGSAGRGGRYAVSALRGARVQHHAAVLGPVQPGHDVEAWLPRVRTRDARVRTSFRLTRHGALGGGEYFDIGLRRRSIATTYFAKIHLTPGGVFASVSRVRDGQETVLGAEHLVLPAAASHGWINVQTEAIGSFPVTLGLRVWRAGRPKPAADQVTYTDRSAERLGQAGSVAFLSYLSHTAHGSSVVEFRRVRVWNDPRRTLDGSAGGTPPTSTPPTSTPPTSTPPIGTPPASGPPTVTPPTGTPPASGPGGVGAATLGSTSYPIPSGAVFVSPSGNDSGPGTLDAPLRTLARALVVAPSGGTIVLRAGTYHESVQDYNKPLTVQNYPGETVWMDGSSVVTGWAQQGSTWVHSGWTAQFNHVPSDSGTVSTAPNWSFVNSTHPMAAWPDQVWVDGSPLNQVASASQVGAGDFYVDYADDQLVLGSDPGSHTVEASDLGLALTTYASDFTFRGIGVRRYATSLNQFGSLRLLGTNDTAENDVVADNATTGLFMDNTSDTIDHVTATGNGLMGLAASYANGLVVDSVLSQGNNAQYFNQSPESGGMKIGLSRGITVRNSQFTQNLGPGLWFDCSDYNATVVGNTMSGNSGHGLSYEISSTALIANNVVQNNGGDGFKINDSDHVRLWNNTVTGNGRDIEVVEDARRGSDLSVPGHNSHVAQPDPTEPWTITDDSVMNNVLSPAAGAYQLYVNDYSQQFTADDIDLKVDGNQFARGSSSAMIVWGAGTANPKLFTTVAAFVAGTGQGANNVDAAAGQPATGGGVALPSDVAAAIGQSAGTVHIGAF